MTVGATINVMMAAAMADGQVLKKVVGVFVLTLAIRN